MNLSLHKTGWRLLACTILALSMGKAFATPQDPAPISDEVLQKLPAMRPYAPRAFVLELQRHHAEIHGLVATLGLDSSVASDAHPIALRAKAHELEVMARGLDKDKDVPESLRAPLRDRLHELHRHVLALANADTLSKRDEAAVQLKALLVRLQPPESALSQTGVRHNRPIYQEEAAPALPAAPHAKRQPAYLSQAPLPKPVVLAMNGTTANIAAVLPPFAEPSACAYTTADVSDDGRNVQLTVEVKQLAQDLGYSPVRIFEWVQENIKLQPYYGAQKGSQATLLSGSGGPMDIDSLTIALLRASNIPARYVFGNITVADNAPSADQAQISRLLGVKTLLAANGVLTRGHFHAVAYVPSGATDTTATGLSFDHSWVEACVPYAHYRGSRVDVGGQRWVPMDPSFRLPRYQPGVSTTSVDLDYSTYMLTRSNEMPEERYRRLVNQYVTGLSPAQTIDTVPYSGTQIPADWDVLPTSLPYIVNSLNGLMTDGSSETAVLPDFMQFYLSVAVFDVNKTALTPQLALYLPDIALKRVTLDFEGVDSAAQGTLANWQKDGNGSSSLPCPLKVVPVIRLDGGAPFKGTGVVDLCTTQNFLDMSASIDLQGTLTVYQYEFPGVAAGGYHALLADGLQNSNRVLTQRAASLLTAVRATTTPNTNLDAIEGGFLDLVGRKFLFHVDEGARALGDLDGTNGTTGHSVGFVTTQAKVEYAFDMPFAVTRAGYLVDVAAQDRAVDLSTGVYTQKHLKSWAYMGSAYESYIWQENARLDAVSTVRGIQYANEKGIPILSVNNSNWASQKALLTSNANNSDTTLNYDPAMVAAIESDLFCSTCSPADASIPRALLKYVSGSDAWTGFVYAASISTNGIPSKVAMVVNGHNGGYSISTPISFNYDSILNTGYSFLNPAPFPVYSNWSIPVYNPPPPIISPAVGLGITPYSNFAGDPVNLVNGNLYHNETDIKIKGRGGFDLSLQRSYNSRDGKDGPLGFGWTHNLNQYLLFGDDNPDGKTAADDTDKVVSSIIWVDASGSRKSIAANSTATTFTTPTGFFFTVTRQADNTFLITDRGGIKYTFENKTAAVSADDTAAFANRARLTRIEDRNGNALVFSYAAAPNCSGTYLCKVTDGLNRSLTLTYNTAGRLDTVADWTGRQWKYGYDTAGNLTSYKNPRASAGKQSGVSYLYYGAADGQNLNHAMKQYILPAGNGMTFEYYINGRVFRHYHTQHPDEAVSLTYNDFRRETVVTNERGDTSHHFFDRNGNPVQVVHEDGGVQNYGYDCRSTTDCPNPYNKLSETDPTGVTINYTYDASGNLIKTQVASSNATTQQFDFAANTYNQPRRVQDARGNWSIARYDSHGNVVDSILFKAGTAYTNACTAECPVPTASTTPSLTAISSWTHRTYDAYGNVTQVKRMRDFANQVGPTLDSNFNDTVNNVQGLNVVSLTRTGDKNGDGTLDSPDVASLSYDNLGRTLTGIDQRWYPVSVVTYDEVDRATVATDAKGRRIETDYDDNGNQIERRVKGTSGTTTLTDKIHYSYNNDDRLVTVTDNAGAQTNNEFDLVGHVIATTNPDGWRVSMMVDSMGRTVEATDAEGNTALRDYDIGGRLQSQTSALNLTVTHSYYGPDKNGRLKRSTMPVLAGRSAGRAVEYDYDVAGNVTRQSAIGDDATTRDYYRFYDEQSRPVREVSPALTSGKRRQVCYKYSNLGDRTELWTGPTTDNTTTTCNFSDTSLLKQVTWVFDDFGRKITETDPNNKGKSWVYDVYGNVLTAKDGKNQTTVFTWKAGGLPDTRTDQASHKTTWTYDALMRLYTVADPNVTYTYGYDAAGRVNSVNDSRGNKTLGYAWSKGGLLNRMTDGEGRNTDYLYDPSGRLIGEWLPNGDYVALVYDADGRLAQRTASTGARAAYTWFNDGSLASIKTYKNSSTVVTSASYTLNAFGQRATIDEVQSASGRKWRYTYDNLGELYEAYVAATLPTAGSETLLGRYNYDGYGCLSQLQFADGSNYGYNYDNANQLLSIYKYAAGNGTPTGAAVFTHDDNGSVLTKQTTAGTTTYTWDELNRLKTVSIPYGTAVSQSYVYDPLGRRISKVSGSTTTNYLLDGPDPMAGVHAVYSSWTSPDALIAPGMGTDRPLARMPLSAGAFQATLDYHADGANSVVAISQEGTGGSADTTQSIKMYGPWGTPYASGGTAPSAVEPAWQGRERDETGLSYFRARYYDPGSVTDSVSMVGHFISRDPAGFDAGVNAYGAFANDPVNLGDPSGMTALSPAQMQAGINGLIATSRVDNFLNQMGLGGFSSANQSMAYVSRPPPPPINTYATIQTALAATSFVPGLGTVTGLISAGLDFAHGDYAAAGLSLASAIPIIGEVGAAARTGVAVDRAITSAARVEQTAVNDAVVFNNGFRTADGKFASVTGQASPGTAAAKEFADHLSVNGVDVVGTEMSVQGPLGRRTYDVVTRREGKLWGIEVKTGGATKDSYQDFSDSWVNQFGAPGIGKLSGQTVSGSSTVFLP